MHSRYWSRERVPMGPNSENAFLEDTFWPNSIHIKTFLKHYNQQEKKIMFRSENRGETLFFMSRHFDQTMTILISHFLRFGALKDFIDDWFVIRINNIIYSKQDMWCFINLFQYFYNTFSPFWCTKEFYWWLFCDMNKNITHSKQNMGCFINFSIFYYFYNTFPTACFPIHVYRAVYKWCMNEITYQQVND